MHKSIQILWIAGVIFILQFSTPHVVGTDPYYHAQTSLLGRELLSRQFPWTQKSLFAEHFADKEFLFHIALAPFVWAGGLTGAKAATVVFATMAVGSFYWLCQKRNVPSPFLWTVFLFASADLFLYRLSITRPHILSLFLTLLLCQALLERRTWRIAGLCTVFALTYTAYHLPVGFAVLYALNRRLHARKWETTVLSYALFGAMLGILIHPHFPNNLLIWKVQNVDVLRLTWSGVNLGFGAEFNPPDSRWFLMNFTVAFFCLPVALFVAAWRKTEIKEDSTYFIFLAFGFFCLTLMSRRFAEYWPAYALLASACLTRDIGLSLGWKNRRELGSSLALWIIAALFFIRTYSNGMRLNEREHEPYYKNAALWIKEHAPAGETIYHGDWDDFPQLFYFNPDNRYLVCLDPIFLFAYDPELWLTWKKIGMAESLHPEVEIKTLFGSRFAFFSIDFSNAIEQFRKNPAMTVGYEDNHCIVFEIHEDRAGSQPHSP